MRIKEFITICLLLVSVSLFAQEKTIEVTGVVTDMNKEPLVGVNVTVKDKPGLGAITDINGRYKIKTEEFSRLVFSYIGFDTQEVLVKRQNLVNISMKESEAKEIDEVVITGTGAQKKLTVTGAVTNVDVEVLKSNPTANLSNALAGNVSGVLAMQTSGQPGVNTSEFWIRGISTFGANSAALVLVDGFERDLDEINIEDIESFTVLKDASTTAIYGSRGANGVVLITTKRGKEGKIKINAKVESSYNSRTITPEFADGYSYAMLMNEARITRNQERMYQDDEMEILRLGLDQDLYPNVDWMDVLMKDGAMTYRANLNMSGGGSTARYFVSLSYINEEGMYKTDEAMRKDYNTNPSSQRWNYRLNTDIDITKSTLVKVGVSGSLKKRNAPGQGANVWTSLMGQSPISIPVMYSNGYIPSHGTDDNRNNPWVLATQSGYKEIWNNKIQTNISLEQKLDFITKGLRFEGRFGFDTSNQSEINRIRMPETWRAQRDRDDDGNLVFKQQNAEKPMEQTSSSSGERREFLEAFLQYNRAFKAHHVGGILKYTQDAYRTTVDIGTDVKNGVAKRHMGLVGRVTYNWKERYLTEMNISYTGSEKFARGERFGLFPSFSLGWRLSEEPFIKKSIGKVLTNAKFRYSWGKVGSDAGAKRWNYIQQFTSDGNITLGTDASGQIWGPLYHEGDVANLNSTWEKSTKQNLGIEIGLWNKLDITLDLFDEKRKDILMEPQTTSFITGAKFNALNIGSTKNHGFELELHYNDKIGSDFRYHVGFTLASSENRVVFRDDPVNGPDHLKEAGKPIGHQNRYLAVGNYETIDDVFNNAQTGSINSVAPGQVVPGDFIYIDFDSNGILNGQDKVAVDELNYPLHTYGLNLGFDWKGLSFSAMFYAPTGVYKLVNSVYSASFKSGKINAQPDVMNAWTPETANTSGVRAPALHLTNDGAFNGTESTYRYQNFSYLRLKTMELGYNLPKKWLKTVGLKSLQVYVTGNNLLTWWGGDDRIDPEGEQVQYPILRSFTSGVRVSF